MSAEVIPYGVLDAAMPVAPQDGLVRYMRLARLVTAALLAILLLLSFVVHITSAVVAFGEVTVDSKVKKLAHPTGGVISAIYVRDGSKVRAGQVLMRFDTAVSGVSADASGKNLDQLLAMQARLTAERDGAASIEFPPQLTAEPSASAAAAMSDEQRAFTLRRTGRVSQHAQLEQRIVQDEDQIAAYETQISATHQQAALIAPELSGMRQLYTKQLVTINRMNELERTAVALTSNAAALEAQIAQTRAQIAETRQQMLQLDQDARSQSGTELADVTSRVAEQQVRKATAGDALDRSAIRAPQSGTVDKLAFTTVGGVVPAAQTIMEIVPDTDRLTVEGKVSPNDIDQVHLGQPTELRFAAFNTRTTPEIEGVLRHVSAERETDDRTGSSYYTVLIDIAPGQMKRLGGLALVPGMPVEAYVRTGRRSMMSYLFKPLTDQLRRSFRQD